MHALAFAKHLVSYKLATTAEIQFDQPDGALRAAKLFR